MGDKSCPGLVESELLSRSSWARAPQRVFGARQRNRDRTWPKPGTSMQESRVGESRELFPEVRRGRHEEGLQRDERLTPGADGRVARDLKHPDQLDGLVAGLRNRGCDACEERPGGGLGIQRIGLALVQPSGERPAMQDFLSDRLT